MRFYVLALTLCALVLPPAAAQSWTGPFQLANDTFDDVNPSACPEWVTGYSTGLVWQTNRNGNWDIYAKLCRMMNGNGWGADEAVSTDSADDLNPAVAACNDRPADSGSFRCVWERRQSPLIGSIWASFNPVSAGWQAPESVGPYIRTDADSAKPRIVVIRNTVVDTAWVTWTCHDTDGWQIQYSYHSGDSWYGPWIAVAGLDPICHARLGRGHDSSYNGCPLLTWESSGDIFYSEYLGGSWSAPQEVAHSDSLDQSPEVISRSPMPFDMGPWITWESTRDGDTAIYGTAEDTFSIGRRWCDSTGAGNNRASCGTPAEYTTDYWNPVAAAWVSDRDGDANIYSRTMFSDHDVRVDSDAATDVNPTLTTLGVTEHWCIWQSNRSGNWDLYGSYVYATGVEERREPQAMSHNREQTVVRGVLLLGEAPSRKPQAASLLDISGRHVLELHAGANDLGRLSPGVYFVPEAKARALRKVVVAR